MPQAICIQCHKRPAFLLSKEIPGLCKECLDKEQDAAIAKVKKLFDAIFYSEEINGDENKMRALVAADPELYREFRNMSWLLLRGELPPDKASE